jgi:hypothetical protein
MEESVPLITLMLPIGQVEEVELADTLEQVELGGVQTVHPGEVPELVGQEVEVHLYLEEVEELGY